MNTLQRHTCVLITLAALCAAAGTSLAGEVVLYRQGQSPDPCDAARTLGGTQPGAAARIKTRGLKLLVDTPPPAPVTALTAAPANAERPAQADAVALQVQFPFNSAEIQPDMIPALDAVAEGSKMTGGKAHVGVEGHTDAGGSADYNLRLSQRRAAAVKNYMVTRHAIPAATLDVGGLGKSAPLLPQNHYAPENRRVQFRAVDMSSTRSHSFSPGAG